MHTSISVYIYWNYFIVLLSSLHKKCNIIVFVDFWNLLPPWNLLLPMRRDLETDLPELSSNFQENFNVHLRPAASPISHNTSIGWVNFFIPIYSKPRPAVPNSDPGFRTGDVRATIPNNPHRTTWWVSELLRHTQTNHAYIYFIY